MSAKGRGAHTSDVRLTPVRLAKMLASTLPLRDCDRVLEPSVGAGAFLEGLAFAAGTQGVQPDTLMLHIVEPVQSLLDQARSRAYTKGLVPSMELCMPFERTPHNTFDVIFGNPPYSHAESHVRLCLERLRPGGMCGMLLRLNFLGSADRIPFWRDHPPLLVCPLSERPSFSSDGRTDATEYGWFVWFHGPFHETKMVPLSWDWQARPGQVEQDLARIKAITERHRATDSLPW